ncbi:hypothetical protein AB4390_25110, partial [Vibrio splendidus]
MAHDFIVAKGKLSKSRSLKELQQCVDYKHAAVFGDAISKPKNVAYFHGFADGVMYAIFNAQSFYAGTSGSGGSKYIPAKLAKASLLEACAYIEENHPPHIKQLNSIREFANKLTDDDHVTALLRNS